MFLIWGRAARPPKSPSGTGYAKLRKTGRHKKRLRRGVLYKGDCRLSGNLAAEVVVRNQNVGETRGCAVPRKVRMLPVLPQRFPSAFFSFGVYDIARQFLISHHRALANHRR